MVSMSTVCPRLSLVMLAQAIPLPHAHRYQCPVGRRAQDHGRDCARPHEDVPGLAPPSTAHHAHHPTSDRNATCRGVSRSRTEGAPLHRSRPQRGHQELPYLELPPMAFGPPGRRRLLERRASVHRRPSSCGREEQLGVASPLLCRVRSSSTGARYTSRRKRRDPEGD